MLFNLPSNYFPACIRGTGLNSGHIKYMASTSPSVTTSPSTQGWTYDVFLSFRGPDTRKTFIDFLYESLERRGIRTFKDDDRLEKGDCISTSLIKAIQVSQFLIAVFSEGYASSKWCLEELATMMECHEKFKNQIVVPIFHNVEPSDVRKQEGRFGDLFTKLVERFVKDNEEEEKVRRWKEALKNAGYLKGHHLQNDYKGYEATCAEKVAADIHARLNRESLAFEENLVGLESRVNNIGNWLRLASDDNDDFRFIGICGMGGIGKTTIATGVFNKFSHQFDGACFLADVRQHNVIELQNILLTKILKEKSGVEISNVQDGIWKIRRRLKEKNVLIVLDDVDDKLEQLDKLAGGGDWFGRGSRVIITTRDRDVLRSHRVDKRYVYEVHTLEDHVAIQLFSCYAFKSEIPATGFEKLSGLIVQYCNGLPLALKILGSSLCGLEADDWKRTLEELNDIPDDVILKTLKISFDKLNPKNQKIFLHIACFFRHEKEEYVKDVLESCGNLHPVKGMRVLIEKSLISILEGRIEMHDLIQDMGWHIAREEKPRSRVWEFKEDGVLFRKMELTKSIECILFPYTTYGFWRHNSNDENISSAFEALKILIGKRPSTEALKLIVNNFDLNVKDNYQLPSSLRWLHFPDYPFHSLPTSFRPSSKDTNPLELVGLCLHSSSLENCWITKELNKLTYLDLSSSRSLLETPNFDMMPNLRSLNLSHCEKLKEIHPFIGRLEKLVSLDLSKCHKLQMLPCFVQVTSLQFLKLESCSKLEKFPEVQANMPLVLELNLESIRIRELPSSIGRLRGLTKLRLCDCEYLVHLSDDLCELESLKILELRECGQLESLPENLGNLSKLEELHLFEIAIFQLPSSITQLSSLECLCWGRNPIYTFQKERSLKFLPSVSGLRSLKKLQLSGFEIIDEGLPFDLGQCLISLEYLNLKGSNFDYLPESFSQLPHLQYLYLRDCEELEMLPELPKTIRELYVDSHFAFGKKSINIALFAIKYPLLYSISFSSSYGDTDMYDAFRDETFLAKKSIQFPFHRKTPFSVNYSSKEFNVHMDDHYPLLRSFQYQCFKSNRICFNLNPHWYSTQFEGFAVYFVTYHADMWEPHSYKGFDGRTRHCVIKAKLSSHNDIKNEDLKTKCVIAGSICYTSRAFDRKPCEVFNCFVYLPFSSLWPKSKHIMEASDYSRFEVELVALEANSADWGINLLYKSTYTFPSLEEGAREHMGNYHRSDSEQSNEEAPLFEETPVSSTQPEPEQSNEEAPLFEETPVSTQHEQVVRNQTESFAELFKRHEEESTKANVEMWKEELKKAGEISGYHLQNEFNGFEAKCVEIVTKVYYPVQASSSVLKDNIVGLETRVGYVGKLLTQEPDDVQFIGILGTKGIGKTTIAMVVFNKFRSQFDGACYLNDVKEHKITELQETLLGRLNKEMGIINEVDGKEKIQGWLSGKKVLIVLDDVDQVEQLQKLAGRRDWFGRGSRVIITTRDARVLRSHGVDKKYVYEVHTLEYQKAIQLFSCYAFKSEIPATGFELLSELIVHYCKGLPLALKVLGSSLYGLEAAEWEHTLEQLKGTLDDDILGKLKISFDRLDSKNKKIFLHIACFFRHEEEKRVKEALNALQPEFLGMHVLIEKYFISVQNERIKMHDLIQEMGWRIARDEKHRSRVWEFKEVDDVLCGKMVPKHIESIVFPYTCGFRWQNISNAFEVLKILIGKRSWSYNEEEDNNFNRDVMDNYQFPSSLELIHFPDYPFPLLPTSLHHPSGMDNNPLELDVISSHSCSPEKYRITEELNKLTYLNLSSSYSLLKTPNFDMMPNLEKLYLSGCEKLVEIHSSVGYLKKLVLLDLSYCSNLRRLPRFIQVSSLQFLKLEDCFKLRKFPEIQANMPLVLELNLEFIDIRELPSSIGRLRGLTKLRLYWCSNLLSLSDDLCELENLKILEFRDCGRLKSLPEKLGNLSKLEELYIFETAIFQLPSSITQLSSLECLCWGGSSYDKFKKEISLKFFALSSVSSLRSLKKLELSSFKIIDEGLPSDLGQHLISLEYLNLKGSNFDYLLESFSQLPHLQYLDIRYCEELEKLPQQLPATIRELYANSNLASESNMAKLAIKYPKLYSVSFSIEQYNSGITFSAVELARKFAHAPFQIMRNSSFIVTYPIVYCSTDRDITKWFKYSSHHSNKISISLKSSWFNQSFVGFVVCFILKPGDSIWKSCPHGFPFRYGEVIAQLVHKDNEQLLQTNCVIGRQCDDYYIFKDSEIICFAYIPFHSLFNNELSATPSDYLVFEVTFGDPASNASTDWSCDLLYKNDESFSEAIWSKTTSHHNGDTEHGAAEAAMAEHSAKSPIETSVCKTVFEAPKVQTSEKRKAHTLSSANEEEEEEEDKQRKNDHLDNKDKIPEDIIINLGKQNKGKNEQNDGRGELLATNVQPLFVDDDVFQRLGNDCKQLYDLLREGTMEYNMECIGVELDANIFHHKNVERIFVVIKDIKDLFTMNWLDVSVIQVFIMYLYRLCKEFEVSSIGFMCPTQIAKANVDMNSKAVMAYLRNTMSKLQDKTFILAPYHQVNHWLLLVICTSSRMVYVLDPMQCDRDPEIKPVLNMVFRTLPNQQGQRARWKNIKCPRQPGNSECGYYVMRYMYDICRKYFANTLLDEAFQETEAYFDKEIDEIRNMWAKYFINECV